MTCYNCGYKVSVVSKDDIGWLCEWCSDNELRSPIIKQLKKRIEELKPTASTCQKLAMNSMFYYCDCLWCCFGNELQKIMEVKNETKM